MVRDLWRKLQLDATQQALGEGSREGLTNGLRECTKIDNHRALDVGYLNEGLGNFQVRRPQGSEGYLEVTVKESPDELTLRAEKERWGPPW